LWEKPVVFGELTPLFKGPLGKINPKKGSYLFGANWFWGEKLRHNFPFWGELSLGQNNVCGEPLYRAAALFYAGFASQKKKGLFGGILKPGGGVSMEKKFTTKTISWKSTAL